MQGVSVYVSTLSLTAIALDRLEAVTHATMVNTRPDTRHTVIRIVIINTISILAILPYCVHMEVRWKYDKANILPPYVQEKLSLNIEIEI